MHGSSTLSGTATDSQVDDGQGLQKGSQHLAFSADSHLFLPVFVDLTLADRAIDEPAKRAGAEFIGWTLMFAFLRAMTHGPAVFDRGVAFPLSGEQEIDLAFNVRRDRSPTLFVAVYRLDGTA